MSPVLPHLGLIKSASKAYIPHSPPHIPQSRWEDYSLKKPCSSREKLADIWAFSKE